MKKVGGSTKYIKFNELNKGDIVFEKAKYIETFEGKFGDNHKFMTEDMEQIVCPSAGQLNYLIRTYLTEGQNCKIEYLGKKEITTGAMKGKEAHSFELYVEDNAPTKKVATSTSLDDLE